MPDTKPDSKKVRGVPVSPTRTAKVGGELEDSNRDA